MELFRISKCEYIKDLSGIGAQTYGGRWNSKGIPVLYTAGSRSLAALETLVHVPQKNMTTHFCIVTLFIPKTIKIKKIARSDLPEDWKQIPIQSKLQAIGDKWLKGKKTAILQTPSVVIPEESNYLVNPLHQDFQKIRIKKTAPFVFDQRISSI